MAVQTVPEPTGLLSEVLPAGSDLDEETDQVMDTGIKRLAGSHFLLQLDVIARHFEGHSVCDFTHFQIFSCFSSGLHMKETMSGDFRHVTFVGLVT